MLDNYSEAAGITNKANFCSETDLTCHFNYLKYWLWSTPYET